MTEPDLQASLGLPICEPKISYDKKDNILLVHTGAAPTDDTVEIGGLVLDFDKKGNILGFELFEASRRIEFMLKLLNHAIFDKFETTNKKKQA